MNGIQARITLMTFNIGDRSGAGSKKSELREFGTDPLSSPSNPHHYRTISETTPRSAPPRLKAPPLSLATNP